MPRRADTEELRARSILKERALRVTMPRVRVLATLLHSTSPLNAADVWQRLRTVRADRVTVYRTLNTLVDAGILHRVDPGDRVFRFGITGSEASGAEPGHQHPHFVCDACGTMQCLDDAEVILKPRARPSRARSAPAPPRPLRVSQKDVLLHGTCGDCGPEDRPIASTSTGVRRKARRSLRA